MRQKNSQSTENDTNLVSNSAKQHKINLNPLSCLKNETKKLSIYCRRCRFSRDCNTGEKYTPVVSIQWHNFLLNRVWDFFILNFDTVLVEIDTRPKVHTGVSFQWHNFLLNRQKWIWDFFISQFWHSFGRNWHKGIKIDTNQLLRQNLCWNWHKKSSTQ